MDDDFAAFHEANEAESDNDDDSDYKEDDEEAQRESQEDDNLDRDLQQQEEGGNTPSDTPTLTETEPGRDGPLDPNYAEQNGSQGSEDQSPFGPHANQPTVGPTEAMPRYTITGRAMAPVKKQLIMGSPNEPQVTLTHFVTAFAYCSCAFAYCWLRCFCMLLMCFCMQSYY